MRDELAATALVADTVAERAEAIVTAVRAEITG